MLPPEAVTAMVPVQAVATPTVALPQVIAETDAAPAAVPVPVTVLLPAVPPPNEECTVMVCTPLAVGLKADTVSRLQLAFTAKV
jgi:hypothetical protein